MLPGRLLQHEHETSLTLGPADGDSQGKLKKSRYVLLILQLESDPSNFASKRTLSPELVLRHS